MQAYSDPSRENDPYALPDLEVWHSQEYDWRPDGYPMVEGWYYWFCLPGCLPDSELMGPFESYDQALEDARGDQC